MPDFISNYTGDQLDSGIQLAYTAVQPGQSEHLGFDSVSDLLSDTSLSYQTVAVNQLLKVDRFTYKVLSDNATDYWKETDGGLRLAVVPVSGELFTSQWGLTSSTTTDQGVDFQAYVAYSIDNNLTMVIDTRFINCGGRSIWFNREGTGAGYNDPTVHLTTYKRRTVEIRNGWFTFGKFYDEVNGEPRYSIDQGATTNVTVNYVTFRGVVRIVNCEGTPSFSECNFFPELISTNPTFYTGAPPADWGVNTEGLLGVNGETISTELYENNATTSHVTHLLEVINSNHPTFYSCNVSYASSVSNAKGEMMGSVRFSGCSNPTIVGGLFGTQTKEAIRFEAHPLYGGSNNTNATVRNVHTEDTYESAIVITHLQKGYINIMSRPTINWAGPAPFIHVNGNNLVQDIHIDSWITSYQETGFTDGHGIGTAVQIDGGDNISVSGWIRDFDTAVKVTGGTIGSIKPYIETCTNSVVTTGGGLFKYPEVFSPFEASKNLSIEDSWEGYLVDEYKWRVYEGTGVSHTVSDSGLVVTVPGGSPYDMTQGFKLSSNAIFKPENNKVDCLATVGDLSSTALIYWVGLIDDAAVDEIPLTIGAGDTPTRLSCAEAAGFFYTTAADTDQVWAVAITQSGTPVVYGTGLTGSSVKNHEFRVSISDSGAVSWFVDGVDIGETAQVEPSVALSPSFCTHGRSATAQTIELTNIKCLQAL